MKKIEAVFWAPPYRTLSSSDLGTAIGTKAEAFDSLYMRIASEESTISYINDIYDNAEIELQPDNMEQITVEDNYAIQYIFGEEKPQNFESAIRTLTLYPGENKNLAEVGMLYCKKEGEGSEPAFEEYLVDLKKRIS